MYGCYCNISVVYFVFQDGKRYYQVKWRDSWEPEERLMAACESALQAFWKEYYANVEKEIRKQVVSKTEFIQTAETNYCAREGL